jgi:hypothetical protein
MLHFDGSVEHLPAHCDPVEMDGKGVGFVCSAARHHELGPIALALVKRTVPVDATLLAGGFPLPRRWSSIPTSACICGRGRRHRADYTLSQGQRHRCPCSSSRELRR